MLCGPRAPRPQPVQLPRRVGVGVDREVASRLDRDCQQLVRGVQAVGSGVSELSATFALALEMGARLEDIAGTIHAHPTLSEALNESFRHALKEAVHIINK